MNSKIIQIADKLRDKFLNEPQYLNEISIFLCGGSRPEESNFRKEIGKRISEIKSRYKYSVYYPEDMFIELIRGHQKRDLLSLENLLADSSNAVVILLQSPGTFTELGAFANHEKLKDKLIVIIDPKYARASSFINLGPVRYLRSDTKSKVIHLPMDNSNTDRLVKRISESARAVAENSAPIRDLSNPVSAYRFYLALIYVFEPIPKNAIVAISRTLATNEEAVVITAAETIISSLINERKAFLASGNLSTTSKGRDYLIHGDNTRKKTRITSAFLTELRLEALNLSLRKNYRRIWGEAKGA